MKNLLLAIATVLVLFPACAEARFPHGSAGGGGGACPNGTADSTDPCPTAPAGGTYTIASLSAAGQTSGQTWVSGANNPGLLVSPQTNEPGINYAVGPTKPRSGAVDALDPANRPAHPGFPFDGCNAAVDNGTWYYVDCHGSGLVAYTWDNMDFGANPTTWYSGRTHTGPTVIHFHNSISNKQTFSNFWADLDSSCNSPGTGGTSGGFISVDNGATAAFEFDNGYIDGHDLDGDPVNGCRYQGFYGDGLSILTSGQIILAFNVFKGIHTRPFAGGCNATGLDSAYGNVIDGYSYEPWYGHGEAFTMGSPTNGNCAAWSFHHNVVLRSSEAGNTLTSPLYPDSGSHPTFTNVLIDANVVVANITGGAATGTPTGSITAHTVVSSARCAGGSTCANILVIDSATGTPIAPGTAITVGSLNVNAEYQTNGGITPGGTGTQWYIECQTPTSTGCPLGTGTNDRNIAVPSTAYSSQSGGYVNYAGSVGFIEADAHYGALTISRNVVDTTGGRFYVTKAGGSCTTPAAFSGNTNMLFGAPNNTNSWTSNSSSGC